MNSIKETKESFTCYQKILSKVKHDVQNTKEGYIKKKLRGECFNAFAILKLERVETKHTLLLTELLNPKGTHAMGAIFLNEFLQVIGLEELDISGFKDAIAEYYISPISEDNTQGGRLDILIRGSHPIIIENKIDAKDENNQLLRYANYGLNKYNDNFELLYLTCDGREPNKDSLGGKRVKYKCISYKYHLLTWLKKCVTLSYNKPFVHETIKQYIILIKKMLDINMEKEQLQELIFFLLSDDNLAATSEIIRLKDDLGKYLREEYVFTPLKSFCQDKEYTYINEHLKIQITPKDWNYQIWINTSLKEWNKLFIGINKYGSKKELAFDDMKYYENDFKDLLPVEANNAWPLGYCYILDEINKSNLNDGGSYIAMKNGEIIHWITQRIEDIVKRVENNPKLRKIMKND